MPGNQIANEMSAYIYRRMGKFEYALERILNSYKTDPNNSRLANEVGRTCLLNRDYENAIKYYNKAIELAPNQSRFYCDLSKVYYHTGNLELAIEILSGDFIHSRSDDILYNLATLYFMNKQYDKSLEILNLPSAGRSGDERKESSVGTGELPRENSQDGASAVMD